jgi:hypothetical protein
MTTIERARELVEECEAKMLAWKQGEAQKLVARADANIVDSATRGRRYTDVGLCGFTDKQVIQMAADEIVDAGYVVTNRGNFLTIEW